MTPADRDLLFGVLAIQNGFLDHAELLAALRRRGRGRDHVPGLDEVLEQRGALSPARRALLNALADEHERNHGGDPGRSLAALPCDGGLRRVLESIDDPELHASLTRLGGGGARRGYDNPLDLPALSLDSTREDQDDNTDTDDGTVATSPFPATRGGPALGRFRVLRPHARGGLGAVAVALDSELNREVALKHIQDAYADHPESRARFVQEAEITGGLEHPGIVPVYSLGHDAAGRPYYAMRFIRGESLRQAVDAFHRAEQQPGRDPGQRAVALQGLLRRFLDACNAIAYAHSRGVLHRDIKPGNIMVGPFGETLVVDWGLAKILGAPEGTPAPAAPGEIALRLPSAGSSGATLPGTAIGTPPFMSPEQAEGRLDQLGPASDVYSLGATLYYLLAGKAPFDGPDTAAILERVRRGDFPSPRQVNPATPPALAAVCGKAMALRPQDRYPTPRALADDIERWLADEPVAAHREPWTVRARRWMRRHRALVASSAAGLMVALVGLAAGVVVIDQARRREGTLNRRLSDTNTRLTAALGQVERANDRANLRLDQTMRAIEDYYTGVGQEVLLDQKELRPLREQLLRRPLLFYENLTRELEAAPEPDERSRSLLARGHLELGKILMTLGRHDEAARQWRAAIDQFQPLIAAAPANPSYREEQAATHNNLAAALAETGDHPAAIAEYHQAIAQLEALAAGGRTLNEYQGKVRAAAYNGLGKELARVGQSDEATQALQHAVDLSREMTQRFPDRPELQDALAGHEHGVATHAAANGDHDRALALFRQAADRYRSLHAADPANPAYLLGLVGCLNNLGHQLRTTGANRDALPTFREAIEYAQTLTEAHPNVPDYQFRLAGLRRNLGAALVATGEAAPGIDQLRLAVAEFELLLAAHADIVEYRFHLASSLLTLSKALGAIDDLPGAIDKARDGIAHFEALAAAQPDLAEYLDGLAGSLTNLGDLLVRTGDIAGAQRAYRQAIERSEALVAAHPETPDYPAGLAASCSALGELLSGTGDHPAAIAAFRRAVDLEEGLTRSHPAAASHRSALAQALRGLAVAQGRAGDLPGALENCRRGIELDQALAEAEPEVPGHRNRLGELLSVQATFLAQSGNLRGAVAALREAVRQLEPAGAGPEPTPTTKDLARVHMKLGVLLFQTGDPSAARQSIQTAVALGTSLVEPHPEIPEYQQVLAGSQVALGMILARSGRTTEAVEALRQAAVHARASFAAIPQSTEYRQMLSGALFAHAEILRAIGRRDEAADVTRERIRLWPSAPIELYNAACELALCLPPKGRRDPPDPRAEALAAEAVRTLRAAVAAGWNLRDHTLADPDLAPLRDRDDFRAALDAITDPGFPQNPFARP